MGCTKKSQDKSRADPHVSNSRGSEVSPRSKCRSCSISALKTNKRNIFLRMRLLQLAICLVGVSANLKDLKKGDRVYYNGPSGTFTLPQGKIWVQKWNWYTVTQVPSKVSSKSKDLTYKVSLDPLCIGQQTVEMSERNWTIMPKVVGQSNEKALIQDDVKFSHVR